VTKKVKLGDALLLSSVIAILCSIVVGSQFNISLGVIIDLVGLGLLTVSFAINRHYSKMQKQEESKESRTKNRRRRT